MRINIYYNCNHYRRWAGERDEKMDDRALCSVSHGTSMGVSSDDKEAKATPHPNIW
jgi:hypothetical protein